MAMLPPSTDTSACYLTIRYPIIQKITNLNEAQAMMGQSMACPFCHKNIKTGVRYVAGDYAYTTAAICCILL